MAGTWSASVTRCLHALVGLQDPIQTENPIRQFCFSVVMETKISFVGKMVVRDGGVASGFNTLEEETKLFEGEPELFHVKGSNERDTRAVQVALECQSLNRFVTTPFNLDLHTFHFLRSTSRGAVFEF